MCTAQSLPGARIHSYLLDVIKYGCYCSNAMNGVSSVNVMGVYYVTTHRLKRLVYPNRTVSALSLVKLVLTNSIHIQLYS